MLLGISPELLFTDIHIILYLYRYTYIHVRTNKRETSTRVTNEDKATGHMFKTHMTYCSLT